MAGSVGRPVYIVIMVNHVNKHFGDHRASEKKLE